MYSFFKKYRRKIQTKTEKIFLYFLSSIFCFNMTDCIPCFLIYKEFKSGPLFERDLLQNHSNSRLFGYSILSKLVISSSRVIICGILCTIALGVFTVYYGIPSLIVLIMGFEKTLSSTLTWVIAFVFCFILTILLYCLVERNFQSIGKKYDKALSAYKKKAGANK